MLSYYSSSLPFHYWLASYTAATVYRLVCRSSSESFGGFYILSAAVCASSYAGFAKGNLPCQRSYRRDMIYYTGLLIAAVYLGKLSESVVEHLYSSNNLQGLSQDNRKWIIHVLSAFALIAEAESRIHPPENAKLQVAHSHVTAQRRFFMLFVVCGLGYAFGRITDRFYGFRFTLCAGLGRFHFGDHPDLLAMIMENVCGQSLVILILQIAGVIEALLLKTRILQPEQVEEYKDGALPDPIQKVRFARLLVESVVWYFVWSFLPPTIQKLVGPSAVLEGITLFTVHWIVSKWVLKIGDGGAVIESLFSAGYQEGFANVRSHSAMY